MDEKPITLIISDLHLGGGPADPGDDHVYDKGQLVRFLKEQRQSDDGRRGRLELFINGDFIEFAQVKPSVYTLGSPKCWCSEPESVEKLMAVLCGHAEVFQKLKEFQEPGNCVTIAAGNHDVDLYWPRVQELLRQKAGSVRFALGQTWHSRHQDRLAISHGHMDDPGNRFEQWDAPFVMGPDHVLRLEMCPGTLFMVKFVNGLEVTYPFADNVKPFSALARILAREDRKGFRIAAWTFARFMGRHSKTALSSDEALPPLGSQLSQHIALDDVFCAAVTKLYRKVRGQSTPDEVRKRLASEDEVWMFMREVVATIPPDDWLPIFDALPRATTLGIGDPGTLSIWKSARQDEKEVLREVAVKQILMGRQVVVLGHTHQPDAMNYQNADYFNPGSWTRYVEISGMETLTLDDLRDEARFPYELNFVRVEDSGNRTLKAQKICYERRDGNPRQTGGGKQGTSVS